MAGREEGVSCGFDGDTEGDPAFRWCGGRVGGRPGRRVGREEAGAAFFCAGFVVRRFEGGG